MTCKLCNHETRLVQAGLAGYQLGQTFDVYECMSCQASFVMPLASDEHLYQLIYQNIAHIPGYCRYRDHYNRVAKVRSPLDYLCSQEESYWAVGSYLRQKRARDGQFSILEIGSGMGYFTFALATEGFQVRGIDIANEAVVAATARFGDLFFCADLAKLAQESQQQFDVIVMNQLIEHVPDINGLLQSALQLLAPHGELLITTPNKGLLPNVVWGTEMPPVHLWWLAEATFASLAERFGLSLDFVDFSDFYRENYRSYDLSTQADVPHGFIGADGELLASVKVSSWREKFREVTDLYHMKPTYRRLRDVLQGKKRWQGSLGPDLCAILRRS